MPETNLTRRQKFANAVRGFNKAVFNKITLAFAERGRGPFTILCHYGRKSGCAYRTPVLATYLDDAVIIPLSYGRQVDWLRNVLAQKGCQVIRKKQAFTARDPEILPAEKALILLPPDRAKLFARFKLAEFLHMTIQPLPGAG